MTFVFGVEEMGRRGGSLLIQANMCSLLYNGMGSVGRKEGRGGGGMVAAGLVIVWLTRITAYLSFLARLSRFSWKETKGEGGETCTNLLCSLLRCYLDHFRAQIGLR